MSESLTIWVSVSMNTTVSVSMSLFVSLNESVITNMIKYKHKCEFVFECQFQGGSE